MFKGVKIIQACFLDVECGANILFQPQRQACTPSKIHTTKTRLFKYFENFTAPRPQHKKKGKFSDKKNSDIFHIPSQNIDCGYSLEPPRRGGSNEYTIYV